MLTFKSVNKTTVCDHSYNKTLANVIDFVNFAIFTMTRKSRQKESVEDHIFCDSSTHFVTMYFFSLPDTKCGWFSASVGQWAWNWNATGK